jgi:hypothetical protein
MFEVMARLVIVFPHLGYGALLWRRGRQIPFLTPVGSTVDAQVWPAQPWMVVIQHHHFSFRGLVAPMIFGTFAQSSYEKGVDLVPLPEKDERYIFKAAQDNGWRDLEHCQNETFLGICALRSGHYALWEAEEKKKAA